jgi:DNA polymerase III sliding clamp (beta) subunit (PCNA family)
MSKTKAIPAPVQPQAPASITVDRRLLQSDLAWLIRFVEPKATIPILANVRLNSKDGVLYLSGTDLEIGARTNIDAERNVGNFDITVPAKALLVFAKNSKATNVTLTVTNDQSVKVEASGSSSTIPAMSVDSFPIIPWPDNPPEPFVAPETVGEAIARMRNIDPKFYMDRGLSTAPETLSDDEMAEITIKLRDDHYAALLYSGIVDVIGLQTAIKRTVKAISNEESRFTLNGGLLDCKQGSDACVVTTDGHRLALAKCSVLQQGTTPLPRVLIPRKAMVEVDRVFTDSPVRIAANRNHIHFSQSGDSHEILARKLTGTFPDYERVLPRDYQNQVNIPVAELKNAINQVLPFADHRSHIIHFGIEHAELTLWAETERGRGKADVALPSNGVELVTGFNASYLLDAINVLPKDQEYVSFTFKTGNEPGVFKIRDYTNVVMPCRV